MTNASDPVPAAMGGSGNSNSLSAIRTPLKTVQSLFLSRAASLPASCRDFGVEAYFSELMKDADVADSVRFEGG